MCDERTMADAERHAPATGGVTRREFGAIAMGTGLAVLWPEGAHAAEVEGRDVEVATPDGTAFRPICLKRFRFQAGKVWPLS